jgi:hypothetical protein
MRIANTTCSAFQLEEVDPGVVEVRFYQQRNKLGKHLT